MKNQIITLLEDSILASERALTGLRKELHRRGVRVQRVSQIEQAAAQIRQERVKQNEAK